MLMILLSTKTSNAQCVANFSAIEDSITPGLFYFFGSANMPTNTTYQWSFGDNTTSTLPDPTHQYNAYGLYWVCLTIDINGCTATYCDTVAFTYTNPCAAYFTYNTNVSNSYQIDFYNQSAWGNTSQWYFGDGGSSTQTNPSHVYATAGTYVVCLTTAGGGCTGTYCDTIQVGANAGCSAAFYVYPDTSLAHTYVAVNQCSGAQPLQYIWTWGDGDSSSTANPTHTYANPGYYTICVVIIDANGCVSYYCDSSNYFMRADATPITVNVVSNTTGISTVATLSNINLYPNPATDNVLVSFNSQSASNTVSLIDVTGRIIEIKTIENNGSKCKETLNLSSVADGLYFIKIDTGTDSKLMKLQVSH